MKAYEAMDIPYNQRYEQKLFIGSLAIELRDFQEQWY